MMNEWIQRILGLLAFILGAAACGLYAFVLHEVQARLPSQFGGQFTAPIVLNQFVWDRSTSPADQRKYLLSKACATASCGCVFSLVAVAGASWFLLLLGVVLAVAAADLLISWRRYRGRR